MIAGLGEAQYDHICTKMDNLAFFVRKTVMDRRVNKTTKALINAVRTLLVTHDWDDVTVQLICDTADISRSTFYMHFDHKGELLDLVFGALRDRLRDIPTDRGLDENRCFGFLPALITHMQGHLALFERNSSTISGAALFRQFRQVVDELARDEIRRSNWAKNLSNDQIVFLVGGAFAVLEEWCSNQCPESAESVLGVLDRLAIVMLTSDIHSFRAR